MNYKQIYREIEIVNEIPNPRAPILEWYMGIHNCDIVTAYNIRMREIQRVLEDERERLSSQEYKEQMFILARTTAREITQVIFQSHPNLTFKEKLRIARSYRDEMKRHCEKSLRETEEYIKNFLNS